MLEWKCDMIETTVKLGDDDLIDFGCSRGGSIAFPPTGFDVSRVAEPQFE